MLSLLFAVYSLPAVAIECGTEKKAFLNLASYFGPHLDQKDSGRCYAFTVGKMVEASIARNQNGKTVSVDPDLLAADYYAYTSSADMLDSFKSNLTDNRDLFAGGEHSEIFDLIIQKKVPVYSRITQSAPLEQLKVCENQSREAFKKTKSSRKAYTSLQTCVNGIHRTYKSDPTVIKDIPNLKKLEVYDAEYFRGCYDKIISKNIEASLCQGIPVVASLQVPYDPIDPDNPHPIDVFEVSASDLQQLASKTSENLDEKKYPRLNTNMIKHAIIVSGKITLGQKSYYILKNSFVAEFALLPEDEVCRLIYPKVLVTPAEAFKLNKALKEIRQSAELQKESKRKPTSK